MVKEDNPAGRLYAILNKAVGYADGDSTARVWSEVLGVESTNTVEFLHKLQQLHELFAETRQRLEAISAINRALFLQHFPRIESALTVTNLTASWGHFKNHLDPATMTSLAFCAEELSNRTSEHLLDKDELASLQAEVDSLRETVLKSESLDKGLRDLIVEQLESIRRAILDYRIRGVVSLQKAYEAAAVEVVVNREDFQKAKGTPEVISFGTIIVKLCQLVSLASAGQKIIEFAKEYLPKLLE
jgi:hypothetical protein